MQPFVSIFDARMSVKNSSPEREEAAFRRRASALIYHERREIDKDHVLEALNVAR